MKKDLTTDTDTAARKARFGSLPERVRLEDMTTEMKAAPAGGASAYDPERDWSYYSCLALDLGL